MARTDPNPSARLVVLLGPTAGGKSELAVGLAQALGGQVVSADSMQVYRHLDAGTAKPTAVQLAAVPHHLINCVEPTEPFTVADWLQQAEALIAQMQAQDIHPIVVGGTNLYIKALLEGLFDGPPPDPLFRASLDPHETSSLHERLAGVDPHAVRRIDRNDRKRIVRALEVHHATGQPITTLQTQWSNGPPSEYRHNPVLIGLRWSPEAINRRINARVKAMFHPTDGSEDLVSETRRLLDAGLLGTQAREAIGTKQVLEHLAGKYSADEAMERVKIETRRFARGQRGWLKRYRGVYWLEAETLDGPALLREALANIHQAQAR